MWTNKQHKLHLLCLRCHSSRVKLHKWFSSKSRNDTSQLVNVDRVRSWSMQNEDFARKVMVVPEPPVLLSKYYSWYNGTDAATLIDYLKWRRWEFVETTNKNDEAFSMSCVLLSHALTFPLTLGNHVHDFVSTRSIRNHSNQDRNQEQGQQQGDSIEIRLCCVGPRAEVNLPLDFWREFLISANFNTMNNNVEGITTKGKGRKKFVNVDWIIDFIGPDVSAKTMQSRVVCLQNNDENLDLEQNLDMVNMSLYNRSLKMNYHSGFLHQYVFELYKSWKNEDHNHDGNFNLGASTVSESILNYWDGFILFNPGIGHENLKTSWSPTLEFIIKTRKTILTTAHSSLDCQRDLEVWNSIISRNEIEKGNSILNYDLNPFASRMSYRDPFPSKDGEIHFVNPNHSVLKI